jgi:two-component system sensor histidine kinase KdpD
VVAQRLIVPIRWITSAATLAAIVVVYRAWLHVNPTTVALTLLLLILSLAARWGLRYAVFVSIAATVCYNFFFLPPLGTLTITDPQNWLALLAFLSTAVIASRLSVRIREEAQEARRREREVEVLFHLSRELLQTDNVAELLRGVPDSIARVTSAPFIVLYLAEGARLYSSTMSRDELPPGLQPTELMLLPGVTRLGAGTGTAVPLRAGVRPRGALVLGATFLSDETLEALGGLVSIAIDRAQALETAARSEAAKESERMRSLMLDSITHELRTPLTAIKASATTLLSSTSVSVEDQRDLLIVIDEETDRLNRLVAQAVEMAQLDTQEVHMNLQPTSVHEIVDRGLHACATQVAARSVTVSIEPYLPRVLADVVWLQKVICNLVENAAKYSPPGSPIAVKATGDGDSIVIEVSDRGTGIEPSDQVLIFEKFYRGRAQAQRRPGTGMGLAISRAIVEAHRGSIRVSSVPGEGSTFRFVLPVWRSSQRIT